jgi:acetolactate synthase-1/2/3 large subunit
VIAFQADGSALYTAQALWTQAREGLDVTTVICANREYRILRVELGRADIAHPGPQAESVTSLRNPEIDWVELSRGLGVPAARAENADTLVSKLRRALAEPGPHLIEAIL